MGTGWPLLQWLRRGFVSAANQTPPEIASDFPLGLSTIFVRNDPKNHFTILRVSIPRLNLEIRSSNQNLQLRRPQILRHQILTIGQSYSFLVGFVAIQMSADVSTTMATLSPSPLSADGEKNVAVPVETLTSSSRNWQLSYASRFGRWHCPDHKSLLWTRWERLLQLHESKSFFKLIES